MTDEPRVLLTAGIDVGTSAIKVAVVRDGGPGDEHLLCTYSERNESQGKIIHKIKTSQSFLRDQIQNIWSGNNPHDKKTCDKRKSCL